MTHSGDLLVEATARATYRLGDHLHEWDDASEELKDAYRTPIIAAFMAVALRATRDEEE